jgi:DNA-directed RNA polymerase subunit RPC12/RpoP
MIKVKIVCNDCKRKTILLIKSNQEEDGYYCSICGSANTVIVKMV